MYSFPNYNIRLPIDLMTKKNTRKYFLLFLASFKFVECKETLFYDSISKNINILITDGVGQTPKTCEIHFVYSCVDDNCMLQIIYEISVSTRTLSLPSCLNEINFWDTQ